MIQYPVTVTTPMSISQTSGREVRRTNDDRSSFASYFRMRDQNVSKTDTSSAVQGGAVHVTASTLLRSLRAADVKLKKPLPISVEFVQNGEFVATFWPAGMSIGGSSVRDAIQALEDEIVDTYNIYSREKTLGPEPSRRLKILGGYLGKKRGQSSKAA